MRSSSGYALLEGFGDLFKRLAHESASFPTDVNNLLARFALGSFYVIRPVPDLSEARIKLGFAMNVEQRLRDFLTICPDAYVLDVWPCRQSWEQTAIQSVTKTGCSHVGGGVYDCSDVNDLLFDCQQFFSNMPTRDSETRLHAFMLTRQLKHLSIISVPA